MYDADTYPTQALPPMANVKGFEEMTRRLDYRWDIYGPIHPNESRRHELIRIAAGRIFWVCQKSEGRTWREVTYDELLGSQEQDVEVYAAWSAERGHDYYGYTGRTSRSAPKKLFGIFPLKRETPKTAYDTEDKKIPWVYHTPQQLKRGLEIMVERGMLRLDLKGPDHRETYRVLPKFLDGLAIVPPKVVITEP